MATSADRSRQEWALRLARRGWSVFPLRPGAKEPYSRDEFGGRGWTEVATTDEDTIRGWFAEHEGMNYGVCPGEHRGIVDLDRKEHDGVQAFGLLELEHGEVETFAVDTPSGGRHLYFELPGTVGNAHTFPEGIDVRGAHGYVVGPGCEVDAGEYEPRNDVDQTTRAPDWVYQRMRPARRKEADHERPVFELDQDFAVERALEWLRTRRPAIEGARGDEHTYATAAQIKDFGISEEKCVELMLTPVHADGRSWNDTCQPPWDVGDLERKVENAYSYGANRPGSKGGGVMEAYEESLGEIVEETGDRFAALRAIMLRGGQLDTWDVRREMVIPEWLPAHGFTALLARRGAGKTVTMLDMALRLACDMDWQGIPAEHGWTTVYVCGEDAEGAREQYRAWCATHDRSPGEDRFVFMAGTVDLMSADSTRLWAEFLTQVLHGRRAVVFVDTWQRATSRGGQNKDEDMQTAVHHAEALAKSLSGPAVIAFHPPKYNEDVVMGSSVIENNTTAIWRMEQQATSRKLEVTRMKGKGEGNYQLLRFEEVGLGEQDQFGKEVTGVVAVRIGGSEVMEGDEASRVEDEATAAVARVVRALDLDRKDPLTGDSKSAPYTTNGLAERIRRLLDEAKDRDDEGDPTERARWAQELVDDMAQSGVSGFSMATLNDFLKKKFVNEPRGHDFGDGWALRVKPRGKMKVWVIERAGIT